MVKRKQSKALPGKRFCKQCEQMIPIHSRVCQFCNAPQYTIQQIAKEYKKRLKAITDDDDVLDKYKNLFTKDNPFITELKDQTMYFEDLPKEIAVGNEIEVLVNGTSKHIGYLEAEKIDKISVINAGGDTVSLAWAFRSDDAQYLAISTLPYGEKLYYGHVYQGYGIIQIWKIAESPSFSYGIVHYGKAALDMKWLPAYNTASDIIGTLAVALANGEIHIYNPIIVDSQTKALNIAPIETFSIPELVFSCIVWIDPVNSLAAGTQDGSIFIFRSCSSKPVLSIFSAHKLPISSINWCNSSSCIASCSLDGLLKLWDKEGKVLDEICSSKRWSYHLCSNPLGTYLFFDNDGAISPHKVVKLEGRKIKNKKYVNLSSEATLSTCFSPVSSYAYIASVDGFIAGIFLSELEKSFKKRKSPWSRHCKIVSQSIGDVITIESSKHQSSLEKTPKKSLCDFASAITHIELTLRGNSDIIAWGGRICGIMELN
ncbi:unnamed protein product [Blepharisma stoltei]|uniref:Uncharacterized protein n=1 Tax=Blepharisma stoltei TaxID=1481888 RepID=A0AAU9JUR3_9CILI|nr:unnamed protein product [Blepharisma stoltei]